MAEQNASRETQMHAKFARADLGMAELLKAAAGLRDRLEPVMRPSGDKVPPVPLVQGEQSVIREEELAPFALRLDRHADDIHRVLSVLDEISRRLEL